MAGGQRRHLVEEEQFGPAGFALGTVAAHRLSPNVAEFADADDPGRQRPAFPQKRLRLRIVDYAAIAHEQAALGHGMDGAERIDPVLQWHSFLSGTHLG